ncbi:MAG: hypothetical protein HYV07_33450 [Deltaproteobacteria bacterium]|nr:hypothetical protein [Deltaproteobacteria bacterium]
MISLVLGLIAADPFRAAVIVGVGEPFEGTPPLVYADDDAARFAELFGPRSDALELLAVLDAETQLIFPDAAKLSRVPSRAELDAAMGRVSERARVARASGKRTELTFVYVGHGRAAGGEGEVRLFEGALSRRDLHAVVLSAGAFDRIHVIVDACDAYHFVNARGDTAAEAERAFDRFLESETLSAHPASGAVLATSGSGPTHEWSRLRGGIFSHEVRSGLIGGADADGDGEVSYEELDGFLRAANLDVPASLGRTSVWVRAPAIERNARLSKRVEARSIIFGASVVGRFVVYDDRGLRYSELNKAKGLEVSLGLVPGHEYDVVNDRGRIVAKVPADRAVLLSEPLVDLGEWPHERGGAELPPIFSRAYGPEFLAGFRARAELLEPRAEVVERSRWPAWLTVGASALALSGAVWQGAAAAHSHSLYQSTPSAAERDAYAEDVRSERGWAIGLGVAAAAGAVVSVFLAR